jgi:hypothetical protein
MLTQLTQDMKEAMRAKDKLRLNTVRAIIAELKNMGIEKKGAQGLTKEVASPAEYLDDSEMLSCLRTMVKKRKEAAEQYTEGNRLELAETELAEVAILADYLPQPLSADEVQALVQEAIAEVGAESMKEMGLVMKAVQPKVAGRADGKALSDCVRSLLG